MNTGTRKAEGRSLADFGGPDGLKPAERLLWSECRRGGVAVIGKSRPEAAIEPNTVRAGFLRFLALGGDELSPVHENGVRLQGAWIEGDLDLGQCHLPRQFECRSSQLPGNVTLRDGRCDFGIVLDGSRVQAIEGQRVRVHGDLSMQATGEERFEAASTVNLIGASIGGALKCDGGKFEAAEGVALSCDRMDVNGSVFLRARNKETRFEAKGEVRLLGARIGGTLSCIGGMFEVPKGDALSCDRIDVKGSVFLRARDKETRFEAKGEVRLLGAKIGGNFECDGGKFEAAESHALSCDGIDVAGDMFLQARDKETRFEAMGEVRLLGAKVGGVLSCIGGKFEAAEGDALSCDRIDVAGGVFLQARDKETRFEAKGEVRLLGAKVGGVLSCIGGKFEATNGYALSCDGIDVAGGVLLRTEDSGACFEAKGLVRLPGASIGGNLECIGGKLEVTQGNDAIVADGLRVHGTFFFQPLPSKTNNVSLSGALVARLSDDLASWGEVLVLDGFEYGRLVGAATTHAKERLAWLDQQTPGHRARRGDGAGADFRPQPWQQLQRVLREMGHFEDAREIAIAFEDRLREADRIGQPPRGLWPPVARPYRWVARLFHSSFRQLTGYGYRPMRLLAWMLGVWLGCALWYWFAASHLAVFGPTNPLVFQNPAYLVEPPAATALVGEPGAAPPAVQPAQKVMAGGNWYLFPGLPEEYTTFSPLAYSLDVILPLVDLQQEHDWAPMIPTPRSGFVEELFHFESRWKHVTRLVLWGERLFGWLASLLLVAIVSGLTRRREE